MQKSKGDHPPEPPPRGWVGSRSAPWLLAYRARSFTMSGGNGSVWVHGNATEHIAEAMAGKAVTHTPEAVRMMGQARLTSLQAAVDDVMGADVEYGKMYNVGGWELQFGAPREAGQLPVLFHALPLE